MNKQETKLFYGNYLCQQITYVRCMNVQTKKGNLCKVFIELVFFFLYHIGPLGEFIEKSFIKINKFLTESKWLAN